MDNQIPYDILLDGEIGILRYLGNIIGLLNKYIRQKWLEKGISIDYKNIQGESNPDKNTNSIARYVKVLHIDHIDGLCIENIQLFPNIDNVHIKFTYKYPGSDNISNINRIIHVIPTTCSINIIIPPENMDGFFTTSGSFTFQFIIKTRWVRTTMEGFCKNFGEQILERMSIFIPSHNITLRPGDKTMPNSLIENYKFNILYF